MTRRSFLASCGSAGGALATNGCGRRLGGGFAGYALIATSGQNAVAVVDLLELRLTGVVELGGVAPSAVLAGDRGDAYVVNSPAGVLFYLDERRRVRRSQQIAGGVTSLTDGPAGMLAVTRTDPPELLLLKPKTMVVHRRFPLSERPTSLHVSREGWIAVASLAAGVVSLIDTRSGKRVERRLDGRVADVRFRGDGALVLAANLDSQALVAMGVPSLETIAELPLPMKPQNLCFNADGGQLFVTGDGMDGVSIVFPDRILQVDQTVLAGRDPGAMACSSNPSLLFVASASGFDICVLSIDSRKVIGLVDATVQPTFLGVTPDSQYVLILSRKGGTLALIRVGAIKVNPAVTRGKSAAGLFTVLSVGPEPVSAAVIPFVV